MSAVQTQAEAKHKENEAKDKFVKHLLALGGYQWNPKSKSWAHNEGAADRGALADLRSGLGKEPGEMARVHRHVVPYLPEKSYNDRWYYVTAALFGSYPVHRSRRSLGEAFGPLRRKSDSMEARFVALLNTPPDDLDDHLRHAVSLLKANEQPLDWFRLLDDLLQWDHPEGHVQLRWARGFYNSDSDKGAGTHNSNPADEEQEEERP